MEDQAVVEPQPREIERTGNVYRRHVCQQPDGDSAEVGVEVPVVALGGVKAEDRRPWQARLPTRPRRVNGLLGNEAVYGLQYWLVDGSLLVEQNRAHAGSVDSLLRPRRTGAHAHGSSRERRCGRCEATLSGQREAPAARWYTEGNPLRSVTGVLRRYGVPQVHGLTEIGGTLPASPPAPVYCSFRVISDATWWPSRTAAVLQPPAPHYRAAL